jgi:ketol-acid reductoisomerase
MIVDLMYQGGFNYMRFSVSDTAEYGDLSRGPRIIDEHVRDNMRAVLKEIQDGTFAKEWIAENDEGRPRFNALRQQAQSSQIEDIGKELRGMMPWMDPK